MDMTEEELNEQIASVRRALVNQNALKATVRDNFDPEREARKERRKNATGSTKKALLSQALNKALEF